MRLLLPALLVLALVPLASAQDSPQQDVMVHMDGRDGAWTYVPATITLVPSGLVQLMIFGEGKHSLTLDDLPGYDADIASPGGPIRTAEFRAPETPGRYPFHDKHHPEAKGILIVSAAGASNASAAQPASDAPAVIGTREVGYDLQYDPTRLEIAPGAAFTFRANNSFGHTLTADDKSFDTGLVRPGDEKELRAPMAPGEYPFFCQYHEQMKGVLVVREGASTPAATPAATPTGASASTPAPADPTESNDARGTPGAGLALVLLAAGGVALALRRR